MALNPAIKTSSLDNPTQRANELNNPQFTENQGYFPYDLTHQSFLTPNFGNITPTMVLDTAPADRIVVKDNTKLILNRINGNFLSTMNQYVDSFYVPMRSVFPMNYEKLIPNPTKGDDLPNSALPQFPLGGFVMDYLKSDALITYIDDMSQEESFTLYDIYNTLQGRDFVALTENYSKEAIGYYLSRLTLLATAFSRGQLLDYMDLGFDFVTDDTTHISAFQTIIDRYFSQLYSIRNSYLNGSFMESIVVHPDKNDFILDGKRYKASTLSEWRQAISDILERGEMISLNINWDVLSSEEVENFIDSVFGLLNSFTDLFGSGEILDKDDFIDTVNEESNPWKNGQFINIGRILAYQQVVAQYFTNNTIDNIFNSDLFMQLLRSVMYPSDGSGLTREPVFDYNGVPTEYDYISCAGSFYSLISDVIDGKANRQYIWMTIMFLLRRSLKFGDMLNTARPNLLAVGQLGINVEGGSVSPIDVTKNLLMQRYLNASNYVGAGFLEYMASIHGVTPSDTGTFPRFISHRKIKIDNQVTNNTADEQGKQTTNLVGYSDNQAFDVFIDDFGYLINLVTFDVLPVYTTGIDNAYHFSDRFDLFNPMLQNIGDTPIRTSELIGSPKLYDDVFGYTMRNYEYKYKLSKAHGAFVNNDLAGYMFKYPITELRDSYGDTIFDMKINPDFIRDKSSYLDKVIPQITGYSPAQYFQFIVSCTNEVHAARKIQATPPVLF